MKEWRNLSKSTVKTIDQYNSCCPVTRDNLPLYLPFAMKKASALFHSAKTTYWTGMQVSKWILKYRILNKKFWSFS